MTPFSGNREPATESIVLGGGCFWCLDASFKLLPGIVGVTCGYAGGHKANPTYEEVCGHGTGHAEVVRIDYDPEKTTLERIFDFFWHVHDPTQVGGQGNDLGESYRSIILYAGPGQKAAAEKAVADAQKDFAAPITTEIEPLKVFWEAEAYHQDYFDKHPSQAYCAAVIRPKIQKLERHLKGNS